MRGKEEVEIIKVRISKIKVLIVKLLANPTIIQLMSLASAEIRYQTPGLF